MNRKNKNEGSLAAVFFSQRHTINLEEGTNEKRATGELVASRKRMHKTEQKVNWFDKTSKFACPLSAIYCPSFFFGLHFLFLVLQVFWATPTTKSHKTNPHWGRPRVTTWNKDLVENSRLWAFFHQIVVQENLLLERSQKCAILRNGLPLDKVRKWFFSFPTPCLIENCCMLERVVTFSKCTKTDFFFSFSRCCMLLPCSLNNLAINSFSPIKSQ